MEKLPDNKQQWEKDQKRKQEILNNLNKWETGKQWKDLIEKTKMEEPILLERLKTKKSLVVPNNMLLQRELCELLTAFDVKNITNSWKTQAGLVRYVDFKEFPSFIFENPALTQVDLLASANTLPAQALFNENFKANNLQTLRLRNIPMTSTEGVNTEILRFLEIENAPLQQLPSNLQNLRELVLNNTQVKELPKDIKVWATLRLINNKDLSLHNLIDIMQSDAWKKIQMCEIEGTDISKELLTYLQNIKAKSKYFYLTITNCTTDGKKIEDIKP